MVRQIPFNWKCDQAKYGNQLVIVSLSSSTMAVQDIPESDLQIAQEPTVVDIKRRQNAHSPIHQLPPEILGEIFSFASGVYDTFAERQKTQNRPTPTPVVLCHVCHSWRALVLHSPWLWSNVFFDSTTNEGMIDFVSKNAGSALLHVQCDRDDTLKGASVCQAKAILANTSQLNSVAINFQSSPPRGMLVVRDLFSAATGRAENLEHLKIALRFTGSLTEAPFAGGVLNLRSLELTQIIVSRNWGSHLLQSPHLIHLVMRPAPPTL